MVMGILSKKLKPYPLLWAGMGIYAVVFTVLLLWKYSHFYYDNLDLAIFNNTFWNTLHGHIFEASIHPPSYLGDHFSPFIFLMLPLYALAPIPQTLLIMQTIAIALSGLPIYLIAKIILGKDKAWTALLVSFLWLVNPLVHNMNFFEFELMAFAVLGFLWVMWAYLAQRPWLFIIASLLTLSIREDFVFILFVFTFLALLEKRSLVWKIAPVALSACWGILAFASISMFAPHNSYKFLRYYGWLGGTDLTSIAMSFIMHPIQVLLHICTWYNIEFVFGLLFPLFFFVNFKNKYSLLLITPAAQIMLAGFGGSGLILSTYYAGYLVAILFLLCIVQIKKFKPEELPQWVPIELRSRKVIYAIIAFAAVYSSLAYGSIAGAASMWHKPHQIAAKNTLLSMVPADAAVATTYSLLPSLSSRQYIYLFPYAAIGKNQYALEDYRLPDNTEYLLIDWDEMVLAQMHFSQNNAFSPYADTVPDHLKEILSQYSIIAGDSSLTLMKKDSTKNALSELVQFADAEQDTASEPHILDAKADAGHVQVTIGLPQRTEDTNYYYLEIQVGTERFRLPIGYALYTKDELAGPRSVHMNLFIDPKKSMHLSLSRWTKGYIDLTGIKSINPVSDAHEISTFTYSPTR